MELTAVAAAAWIVAFYQKAYVALYLPKRALSIDTWQRDLEVFCKRVR